MQFSVNQQTFNAPVYTPEAMAQAIHLKTGKPITPALVTSLEQALKTVGNPDLHRDTLSLKIEGFDKILGKVDGNKQELVEARSKPSRESRSDSFAQLGVPSHDELSELQSVSDELSVPQTGPSREEFKAKLKGVTEKGGQIFDRLDDDMRKLVMDSIPTSKEGKAELKTLLHFGGRQDRAQFDARVDVRALLLVAKALGVPNDEATKLKTSFKSGLETTPDATKAEVSKRLELIKDKDALVPRFTDAPSQVKTPKTDLPNVDITSGKTVFVTPGTHQNLEVAQQVNFAVKSLLPHGAPNQAPDLLRTGGSNILLFTDKTVDGNVGKDEIFTGNFQRAYGVDQARKQNGGVIGVSGEELNNITTKAMRAVGVGTGKCAEHGCTTVSLLSDPLSLKQLGVNLAPGSRIILVRGDLVDHTYALIAEPGSVELTAPKVVARQPKPGESEDAPKTEKIPQHVQIKDKSKVVVVDPWMPIPVAHTHARSNEELQSEEVHGRGEKWELCIVIQDDGTPAIVDKDKNGKEVLTPLPPRETSVLDEFKTLQERHQLRVAQRALVTGVVPTDPEERRLIGAGIALRDGTGKAGMYHETHLSTQTPGDTYQAVSKDGKNIGEPLKLFNVPPDYLVRENEFIQQGLGITMKGVLDGKVDRLPSGLREQVQHAMQS